MAPTGFSSAVSGSQMTKRQRVQAVLDGKRPDAPPVSFWHHFSPTQFRGLPAVDAHLKHQEKWDLDFLKVMNDTGFPRPATGWHVRGVEDLALIPECTGREREFEDELEVVCALVERLRRQVPIIVTVFNAWAVLRRLCAPESDVHGPPKLVVEDERDGCISRMLEQDRPAVAEALAKIGRALALFVEGCLEEGADGIFFSVRDDWVDTAHNGPGTYDRIVLPTDMHVLEAASGARFNMLHVCGKAVDFVRFASYPVHAMNWADRYAGPTIGEVAEWLKPAIAGGVDNLTTLPRGTPEAVAAEVRDAVRQAGDRPIMVTPGCTYDPDAVPEANLRALVEAARSAS